MRCRPRSSCGQGGGAGKRHAARLWCGSLRGCWRRRQIDCESKVDFFSGDAVGALQLLDRNVGALCQHNQNVAGLNGVGHPSWRVHAGRGRARRCCAGFSGSGKHYRGRSGGSERGCAGGFFGWRCGISWCGSCGCLRSCSGACRRSCGGLRAAGCSSGGGCRSGGSGHCGGAWRKRQCSGGRGCHCRSQRQA